MSLLKEGVTSDRVLVLMNEHQEEEEEKMSRMESAASFESAFEDDAKPIEDSKHSLLFARRLDEFSNNGGNGSNDDNDMERGQAKEMEYDYQSLSRKEKFKLFLLNLKKEFRGMLEIAFPTVLMNISNKILGLEDMAFIGHLNNENYLAASALANAVFFCFSFISVGLVGGQDTFVAQGKLKIHRVFFIRRLICLVVFMDEIISHI